jgi:hypothetical protein
VSNSATWNPGEIEAEVDEHPEVTGQLDRKNRTIGITVQGGGRTARFKTADPASALWAEDSPCPPWARESVRFWAGTPGGVAVFRDLAILLGKEPGDWAEEPTVNDRKR